MLALAAAEVDVARTTPATASATRRRSETALVARLHGAVAGSIHRRTSSRRRRSPTPKQSNSVVTVAVGAECPQITRAAARVRRNGDVTVTDEAARSVASRCATTDAPASEEFDDARQGAGPSSRDLLRDGAARARPRLRRVPRLSGDPRRRTPRSTPPMCSPQLAQPRWHRRVAEVERSATAPPEVTPTWRCRTAASRRGEEFCVGAKSWSPSWPTPSSCVVGRRARCHEFYMTRAGGERRRSSRKPPRVLVRGRVRERGPTRSMDKKRSLRERARGGAAGRRAAKIGHRPLPRRACLRRERGAAARAGRLAHPRGEPGIPPPRRRCAVARRAARRR